MSWYYSQVTGSVSELTGTDKWLMDREIQLEQASAKVGVPEVLWGPFTTQQEAQTFAQAHPSVQKAVTAPVTDVTSAITSFSNTLVKLFTRLAEAAVGVVLLAIAANVILKQTTGFDAAGTAIRTGKRAAGTAAKATAVAA